jgi:hypothetical protein
MIAAFAEILALQLQQVQQHYNLTAAFDHWVKWVIHSISIQFWVKLS